MNPAWYAIYTKSRYEKRVSAALAAKNFTIFLPLCYKPWRVSLTRCRDVWVPLFTGYVFVELDCNPENYYRVASTTGFVRFVGSGGKPTSIPSCQIDSVRRIVNSNIACQPSVGMRGGDAVTVRLGPLAGLQGRLVRQKGRKVFVVSLDLLKKGVLVEIDAAWVESTSIS